MNNVNENKIEISRANLTNAFIFLEEIITNEKETSKINSCKLLQQLIEEKYLCECMCGGKENEQ